MPDRIGSNDPGAAPRVLRWQALVAFASAVPQLPVPQPAVGAVGATGMR